MTFNPWRFVLFDKRSQQDWRWTELAGSQKFPLRAKLRIASTTRPHPFKTVASADYQDTENEWRVETGAGDEVFAKTCIMATGCLSSTNRPAFDGIDVFEGEQYHTGLWPHHPVNFSGKRVGIVGTGSSAIQSIPIIAESAAHLTVFQRTYNYSIPAQRTD